MYFRPLSTLERAATGMTHIGAITANDLIQTTVNTAQSFNLAAIPLHAVVTMQEAKLITPFKDPADAAFNSTTVDIGDTGSATRWQTAQQVNENGTEITAPVFSNTGVGPYLASQFLTVNFNSMAAKALNNLKVGEIQFLYRILDLKALHDAQQTTVQTK